MNAFRSYNPYAGHAFRGGKYVGQVPQGPATASPLTPAVIPVVPTVLAEPEQTWPLFLMAGLVALGGLLLLRGAKVI